MKRILSLALVMCLVACVFAGCGGGSGNGGSTAAYTDKPVTYTLFLKEHVYQPIKTDAMKWNLITEKTGVTLDSVGFNGLIYVFL